MASDEAAIRRIARATRDEIFNSGVVNLDELRQVLRAENSDVAEFYCKGCGASLSSEELKKSRCGRCGSSQATDSPVFRCVSCKSPVCIKAETCMRCGGREAIPTYGKPIISARGNPKEHYTCSSCLRPVSLKQPSCSCGSTEAYRTVVR